MAAVSPKRNSGSSSSNAMAAVFVGEETAPKNLVGSVKAGALNYLRDMKAFDSQLVPEAVRANVQAIKQFIEKDMLGTKAKEWTTSTYVDRMRSYERQVDFEAWKFQTRAGLRDYKTTNYRPPRAYEGCDLRNVYSDWNVSIEVNQRELKKQLAEMTEQYRCMARARSAKEISGYKPPLLKQTLLVSELRKNKEDDAQLREELRKQYVYEHPKASQEKISANVFRLAQSAKLKQKQADVYSSEVPSKFKPDLRKTLTGKRVRNYYHNGVWKQGAQDKFAWSCCMNEEENSQGCVVRVRAVDRWNLEGP